MKRQLACDIEIYVNYYLIAFRDIATGKVRTFEQRVDPETGEWSTAFHPPTPEHDRLLAEWKRRGEAGQPRLELFGPEMWSPLPGLITGLILTGEGGPIYLTGLGNALVKIEPDGTRSFVLDPLVKNPPL